jgi:periplasmic protein TonB
MVAQVSLCEFPHDHAGARVARSSRVMAGVLTAVLYALFAVLVWNSFLGRPLSPTRTEIVTRIVPDVPEKKITPLPPPFLAHLIRPHAQTIAPPTFTVASSAPVAPAQLPASAAKTSPLTGGVPAGTGTAGEGASANGSNGNGSALAGCLDPAWMRAVTDRVRQFFYYPGAARALHATGLVMVHFIVRRDGQLDLVEIGKSSGEWALDDAAADMMRKAQPLPPIPDHMHADRIDAILPIIFGIRGLNLTPSSGTCG